MKNLIKIANHFYDVKSEHFSLKYGESVSDINILSNLSKLTYLKSASFPDSDLNDEGLAFLSTLIQIENLNLQDTEITNEGTKYLKKFVNLKYLRLKDNSQLTNDCISNLVAIENLQELQIHETSINQEGLKKVAEMKNIKYILIDVWNDNFTFEGLLEISVNSPNCRIFAKGDGEFYNGKFEGKWKD
jgi:hypothetical protein